MKLFLSSKHLHSLLKKKCVILTIANMFFEMSSDENPVDIPLYWLVNRDPYIGLF